MIDHKSPTWAESCPSQLTIPNLIHNFVHKGIGPFGIQIGELAHGQSDRVVMTVLSLLEQSNLFVQLFVSERVAPVADDDQSVHAIVAEVARLMTTAVAVAIRRVLGLGHCRSVCLV